MLKYDQKKKKKSAVPNNDPSNSIIRLYPI